MNVKSPTDRRDLPFMAVAAVAVGIGIALRFVLTETPLWLDEAQTAAIVDGPFGRVDDGLRRDGHPPLYYWLLWVWSRLVGDGDGSLRLLSALIGVATVPLAVLVARRIGGRTIAIATAALTATSPFLVRYSTEVRMYSMVTTLSLGWWLAATASLRRPSTWRLAAVALSTAALLLTHYWAVFLVGAGLAMAADLARRDSAERPAVGRTVAAAAVGSLAFVAWLPSFLTQLRHTGTPWAVNRNPAASLVAGLVDLAGDRESGQSLALFGVLAVLLVVGVLGAAQGERQIELVVGVRPAARPLAALAGLTILAGLGVTAVLGSAFASRYFAVVVGFVLVLAARGVGEIGLPAARAVVLAVTCLLGVLASVDQVTQDRSQGRQVAAAVDTGDAAGDLVVACPDQVGPATVRYLAGDAEVLAYPLLSAAAVVDWTDYADRNVAADPGAVADELLARAGDRDIWLVWRGGYRTFGDQCERLVLELGTRRGAPAHVVTADPDLFEPMHLSRFAASG